MYVGLMILEGHKTKPVIEDVVKTVVGFVRVGPMIVVGTVTVVGCTAVIGVHICVIVLV